VLNIWLIQIGEPLLIHGDERKMRSNLLAEELARRGHDVTLWVSAFDHNEKKWAIKDAAELIERERIRVVVLRGTGYKKNISFRRYLDHRVISWKFKHRSKKEDKPDVVIASLPPHDLAHQAVKYAKRILTPVIVDIRDPWPDVFVDSLPDWLKSTGKLALLREIRMVKATMRKADCLVAVSNEFLEWGLRYGKRNRSSNDRVYYLGYHCPDADAARFDVRQEVEETLDAVGDRTVVTYIGTFSGFQDPSIVVECARRLESNETAFIFTGYGDLYEKAKEMAGSQSNAFFIGWLNGEEIDALLLKSDIGVCPYSKKSSIFPNKAFMYMSAGIPIVSSYRGDLKSIIESERIGFYFDPGDIDALTKAVDTLCGDSRTYEEMSGNARSVFASEFDDEDIYRAYAGYVESVAVRGERMQARYSEVTESPGQLATKEQLERLYQRYRFASGYADGGEVLEVGCGSGLGLGFLAKYSSKVVGGDVDRDNVDIAAGYYADRDNIAVLKLDAHDLPFADESFDLVLLFEAIYYLEQPDRFVSETFRLLREDGHLIICTVNRNWKDFHPSKYSRKYLAVPELSALLASEFSHVELYGAFEVVDASLVQKCLSAVKRTASRLNLIPGSLKARELLKRVFIGRLEPIPPQVNDGMADYQEPVPIAGDITTDRFKIIYAVASKRDEKK
jgi:glycosyltransferase involved in cell wall biosynthesis